MTSTALAIAALAAMLPAAAPARPAADDLSMSVHFSDLIGTQTNSPNFRIDVEIESSSSVEQPITIRVGLPDGLRWGTDGPDPGEGCTGTAPAICATKMQPNEVGTIGGGYRWDVVADRPGVYEITASVEPTEPDPDMSNNTDTFRFEVLLPPSGGGDTGGGGSEGGGSGVAAKAGAVKLTPAKPKAGSLVTATVRVTAGSAAIRPTRLTCAAAIGSAKLKGTGKTASGSAACVYRTPKAAKDKTLRGSVSFLARATKFTKRFSARLG
jgi:hypothetical protein